MRTRNKPGTTLVDVLTAIAIIGILCGLLLPVLYGPRCTGCKRMKCLSNLDQMSLACTIYSNDNGCFPFVPGDAPLTSLNRLYPQYIRDYQQFQCPSTNDKLSTVDLLQYLPKGQGGTVPLSSKNCDYGFDNRHGVEDNGGLAGDFTGGSATSNSTNHGTTAGKGNGQNLTSVSRGNMFFSDYKRTVGGETDNFFTDDQDHLKLEDDTYLSQ